MKTEKPTEPMTLDEYESALKEIDRLNRLAPTPDSPDGARLAALADHVAAYEREKFGASLPPRGAANDDEDDDDEDDKPSR